MDIKYKTIFMRVAGTIYFLKMKLFYLQMAI